MTDKERLEEIKEKTSSIAEPMLYIDWYDTKWLIKQAERVQVLESRVSRERHHKLTYRKIARRYQSESGRYREALRKIIKEGENGEYSHYTAQRALEEKTDE